MNSAAEFAKALQAVPYGEPNSADRVEYRARQAVVIADFRAWLADEYGHSLNAAQNALIWEKAWEDGHSSGLQEVEHHYIELNDLALRLLG